MVLLSKLDETIKHNAEHFELGCNQFPGTVHPGGYKYLQHFEKYFFPTFEYSTGGIKIRKTIPGTTFDMRPDWYYDFEYSVEQFRGLDYREDLFTHGVFKRTLKSGDKLGVIISTQNPAGRDAFKL